MSRQVCNIIVSLIFGLVLVTNAWATGPWHATGQNTAGWKFMTPDERIEHQRHMRSLDTYEECKTYQAEHHARMAERARREGVILERKNQSRCEQLRSRGRLN
ncbi:MAG: hypothetical protein Q7T38_10490 [Gallionella sp.]|nr:hypothetical protein [Gallionella sp.]